MNFKKVSVKFLSVVMTLAMMLGVCAPFASAIDEADHDHDEKRDLIYVSIGDSMTNGYGMDGYDGESGVVNYANQTYANRFAAWLAGYTGAIENDQVIFEGANGVVDHRQLAMSGLRAEDLYWILTLNYENAALLHHVP